MSDRTMRDWLLRERGIKIRDDGSWLFPDGSYTAPTSPGADGMTEPMHRVWDAGKEGWIARYATSAEATAVADSEARRGAVVFIWPEQTST